MRAIQAELERITKDVASSVSAGADASDDPIAAPLSIVVFGATGDLAREKLYPSFRNLMVKGLLPYGSTIMACVRPRPHVVPALCASRQALCTARPTFAICNRPIDPNAGLPADTAALPCR